MVTRTSQAVDFGSGGKAEFSQQAPGMVGARQQQEFDARTGLDDSLIKSILGDAETLAKVYMETSQEEAFLRGSAKAAQGEAEAALDSNPLTADWEVAGYRDTKGKIAFAEADANLAKDMQTLREGTPEQFQQYLSERREKLMPTMQGMSREARASMLGQMLIADRAATTSHATEHMAFQIDTKIKATQAQWAPIKASLDASLSKGGDIAYMPEVTRVMGFVGGTIWTDPALPDNIKQDMTMQAVGDALSTGNVKVYTEMKDRGMLGLLSVKNQEKLSEAHRQAMDRTEGARLLDLSNEESYILSSMKQGTYQGGIEGVHAYQAKALRLDPKDGGRGRRVLDAFLDMKVAIPDNSAQVAANHAAGNFTANAAMGVDDSKGFKTLLDQMVKDGASTEAVVATTTKSAMQGSNAAAKYLGGVMEGVVMGLDFNSKEISVENALALENSIKTVQVLESEGKYGSVTQFYSGMSERAALRMKRLKAHGSSKNALTKIAEMEHQEATMPPVEKAAKNAAHNEEYMAYRENIAPNGTWERFKSHLPWVGKTRAQAQLSPATSLFTSVSDDSKLVQHYAAQSSTAFADAWDRYRQMNVNATPEEAVQGAEEAVMRSLVQTPDGPLVLHNGVTPAQFFSVGGKPSTASPEQLGAALSTVLPRTLDDGRFGFTMQGPNILVTEYSNDGRETINSREVTPEMVQARVQEIQNGQRKRADEADGRGFAVPLGDTVGTLNGANTASMATDVMVTIRKNLIKHEGFTKGVQQDVGKQKDANGNDVMTTGIGISSTNTYFPKKGDGPNGEITPEQHLYAFKMATNEAATNAVKLTNALGLKGAGWQVLATELIYQSGIGNVTKLEEYQRLFQNKEPADALELIEQTPAFKMSGASRQRHYRALVYNAMNNS